MRRKVRRARLPRPADALSDLPSAEEYRAAFGVVHIGRGGTANEAPGDRSPCCCCCTGCCCTERSVGGRGGTGSNVPRAAREQYADRLHGGDDCSIDGGKCVANGQRYHVRPCGGCMLRWISRLARSEECSAPRDPGRRTSRSPRHRSHRVCAVGEAACRELQGRMRHDADEPAMIALVAAQMITFAPPAGFEPAHTAPEAVALSPELRGLGAFRG
jgi:hypothetical protein